MSTKQYQKHIVTDLKLPEEIKKTSPESSDSAPLALWMDKNVVENAFQMVCVWYLKASPQDSISAHTHNEDEIIGFFGSDPWNSHDLGGEIEIWLEDEQYVINKSCLIFVPKGVKHCPLIIRRVDRPIFHFTTVTEGQYFRQDAS